MKATWKRLVSVLKKGNLKQTVIITINSGLETKNIKKSPHSQSTYGTSKEHLMNILI